MTLNLIEKTLVKTFLKVESDDSSYKWGKLGAKLNGTIDTGYLIYVDCGYLHALEGYTYAEEWPEDISEIETYIV